MNDYVRDILDESYQIKDQTRQGEPQKGDDAGEVDIQICVDGLPLVMIEALILDSLKNSICKIILIKCLLSMILTGAHMWRLSFTQQWLDLKAFIQSSYNI